MNHWVQEKDNIYFKPEGNNFVNDLFQCEWSPWNHRELRPVSSNGEYASSFPIQSQTSPDVKHKIQLVAVNLKIN